MGVQTHSHRLPNQRPRSLWLGSLFSEARRLHQRRLQQQRAPWPHLPLHLQAMTKMHRAKRLLLFLPLSRILPLSSPRLPRPLLSRPPPPPRPLLPLHRHRHRHPWPTSSRTKQAPRKSSRDHSSPDSCTKIGSSILHTHAHTCTHALHRIAAPSRAVHYCKRMLTHFLLVSVCLSVFRF